MAKKKKSSRTTFVILIQDRSGSMNTRRSETIDGYNEYVNTLKHDAEGDVYMSLVQFDHEYLPRFEALYIEEVPRLNASTYVPRGMTRLYDAIGRAVEDGERHIRKNDRVHVVIMTDGLENDSKRYNANDIRSLRSRKEQEGWEFTYLGAGANAWRGGRDLGFHHNERIDYSDWDAEDHRAAFVDVAHATSSVTRGATAHSYLATSLTKSNLEAKAGSTGGLNAQVTSPTYSPKPSKRNVGNPNQLRDSRGRFIRSR